MADADSSDALKTVRTLLRTEMEQAGGVLPFARFQEIALYTPHLGYYERASGNVGRAGDFYTSVSVGPLFGELLTFSALPSLRALAAAAPEAILDLVEAGAHDGSLSADVLSALDLLAPDLRPRRRLWIVEPSPTRQGWQRERLAPWTEDVRWVESLDELQARTGGVRGWIYSNELLDAFPVHVLAWNAAAFAWEEQGVTWDSGEARFRWRRLVPSSSAADPDLVRLNALPRELRDVLPDGFRTEVAPAAKVWWRAAADLLRDGEILTCDYGGGDDTFLVPARREGSLRSYQRHRLGDDPLANPGAWDLTAHVHFDDLRHAGEAAGLVTVGCEPQRTWLTRVLEATQRPGAEFPEWDAKRVRQFQTLTHPQHLGRAFQVLHQRR